MLRLVILLAYSRYKPQGGKCENMYLKTKGVSVQPLFGFIFGVVMKCDLSMYIHLLSVVR